MSLGLLGVFGFRALNLIGFRMTLLLRQSNVKSLKTTNYSGFHVLKFLEQIKKLTALRKSIFVLFNPFLKFGLKKAYKKLRCLKTNKLIIQDVKFSNIVKKLKNIQLSMFLMFYFFVTYTSLIHIKNQNQIIRVLMFLKILKSLNNIKNILKI